MRNSIVCLFGLAVATSLLLPAARGAALERITGEVEARVYASGLSSPDGLAQHPVTREIYVTEEQAGRISVIRNGAAVPVVSGQIKVMDLLPDWAVDARHGRDQWLKGVLESPEGLAIAADGSILVVEDVPNGRLLEFAPDTAGRYPQARVIPVPLTIEDFAWESVQLARDGRIFIAGSSMESGRTLSSGAVLMRDPQLDWWLVDLGPFATFSALTLSRDQDVLVVGDEGTGGVTWWDAVRHREIDTLNHAVGRVEGLCTLPDGSIVVAQENTTEPGTTTETGHGRLLRINPVTRESTVFAAGFGTIESVMLDEQTGLLYVTEDDTGLVLELRPREQLADNEYLLTRSLYASETKAGWAPKQFPPFLKRFFKTLGVETTDESLASHPDQAPDQNLSRPLTLEEIGARLPLVAGKVKVGPGTGAPQADPVTELNFIHFFPNKISMAGAAATPSFSLFAAKRQSGRIERTKPLLDIAAMKKDRDNGWSRFSENAALYLPITTCSAVKRGNDMSLTMCFLGLGSTDDYYLTLNFGGRNEGYLTTDPDGVDFTTSPAEFVEYDANGREIVNVVMTGFQPKNQDDMGWFRIGQHNRWTMQLPERGVWLSRWVMANMPQLVALTRDKENELLTARRLNTLSMEQLVRETLDSGLPTAGKDSDESENMDDSAAAEETTPTANLETRKTSTAPEEQPEPVVIKLPHPAGDATTESITNIILSKLTEAWQQTF